MIIEASCRLEHPVQFLEARFHISYISGDVFKFIRELPLVVFSAGGAIAAAGIEGRVDIDQVYTFGRERLQPGKTVTAVDEAGFHGCYCITVIIAIDAGIKYN